MYNKLYYNDNILKYIILDKLEYFLLSSMLNYTFIYNISIVLDNSK